MQTDTKTNLDRYDLPPNAFFHLDAAGHEPFAVIGENMDPEEFFLRDSTGRWHCVESCDYYAVYVWRSYGAAVEIVGNASSGNLTVRFRDWRGSPKAILFPIAWPDERGEAV